MSVPTYITSDLHLGSPFCRHEAFHSFLDRVPDGARLILNGDTIDNPYAPLPPAHQALLVRIAQESNRLVLIWIEGNHDDGYRLSIPAQITYCASYVVDDSLFVCHGHYFDNVMPYHRWFIVLFKCLHRFRIWLGAAPVHVALYAKRWRYCYSYLCHNVMMNAVEHCREHSFAAAACGHVHYAEDTTVDGIRYLNTGAWTEPKAYFVRVEKGTISLGQA